MFRAHGNFSRAFRVEVPARWKKPLYTAVFVLLACHFTLLSSKPPQGQPAGDANPFAFPDPAAAEAYGAAVSAQIPQQPPPLLLEVSASARIVLQAALAADLGVSVAFPDEPGWGAPAAVPAGRGLAALSFGGEGLDIPSPVRFTNMPGVVAQTVILAARGGLADLATLVDGPETARLRAAPEGSPEPEMTGMERALTDALLPGQWQVIEVDFAQPADLSALFFGGSAGRPAWRRNWRGEIAEAVVFDVPPGGDVRAGVANYLAIRWGAGARPATPEQRAAAVAAGLRHGGIVWRSALFLK